MLRYWRSERTLWLNDVFGTPESLPPPTISDNVGGQPKAAAMTSAEREAADRTVITAMLGRDPWS